MFVNTATTRGVLRSLRTYVKHRKYYADYMEGRNVQPSNVELIVSSLYKKNEEWLMSCVDISIL